MKIRITENDINIIVKKILKEDEDYNISDLRKAVEDYKGKNTPISKKTGEPVKSHSVPFHGYNIPSEKEMPLNIKSFYNTFKKNLGTFNIRPSITSKEEILNIIEQILTLNGFK